MGGNLRTNKLMRRSERDLRERKTSSRLRPLQKENAAGEGKKILVSRNESKPRHKTGGESCGEEICWPGREKMEEGEGDKMSLQPPGAEKQR